jgi:hypothetical protein
MVIRWIDRRSGHIVSGENQRFGHDLIEREEPSVRVCGWLAFCAWRGLLTYVVPDHDPANGLDSIGGSKQPRRSLLVSLGAGRSR